MAVMNGGADKPHGGVILPDETEQTSKVTTEEHVTLYGATVRLIESVLDQNSSDPVASRIRKSVVEAVPVFRKAAVNTRRDVIEWSSGSPVRGLLVVSAGIVTLLALTGMLVFTAVFVAATVNAIVISLLISLAAVGGFVAIFFACMTAMYFGVLLVAAFVTFTVTVSSIIAALIAAGWIGFFWMAWLGATKSAKYVKRITDAANASG